MGEGNQLSPAVGIGYRLPISPWIVAHLSEFDVLEITIDHYIHANSRTREVFQELVGRIPLIAHGVGLSIGTDAPLDIAYLEDVASAIDDLKATSYSEHLAWTKVPSIDFANLLPLPKNKAVADIVIQKIKIIQSYISVPFDLENISYIFDYPDSHMSDAEFFNYICAEAGIGILLDVENLFVNSKNQRFDPKAFLDSIPSESVRGIHTAGGPIVRRDYLDQAIWVDTHSHRMPDEALNLLSAALVRQKPETIILERDDMIHQVDELSSDVRRIRNQLRML